MSQAPSYFPQALPVAVSLFARNLTTKNLMTLAQVVVDTFTGSIQNHINSFILKDTAEYV